MFRQALTHEEVVRAIEAKNAANETLKNRRKEITNHIKRLRKKGYREFELKHLEADRENIKLVVGCPVVITIRGLSMYLDLELLRKFDRMIDPSKWARAIWITESMGKTILRITYKKGNQSGSLELYGLPDYQTELLENLPVISLEG